MGYKRYWTEEIENKECKVILKTNDKQKAFRKLENLSKYAFVYDNDNRVIISK